jgi:hypothetical protein
MRQNRLFSTVALLLTLASDSAAAQSVVNRTPSLSGAWLAAPRVVQFNFVHRFRLGAAPERRISNSPTFVTAVRVPRLPAMVGATYASNSDVVARMPNEWEFSLRAVQFAPGNRIADVSLRVGFNQGSRSVDGELSLSQRLGRVRPLASGRAFTRVRRGSTTARGSGYAGDPHRTVPPDALSGRHRGADRREGASAVAVVR